VINDIRDPKQKVSESLSLKRKMVPKRMV